MHLKENSEKMSKKQTHKQGDFKPKSSMKLINMTQWDDYKQ